jgi:pyridoxamine 5'-phosphate oxidase
MCDRSGIFAGNDPFELTNAWLKEAEATELNDPNAASFATVDAAGMPNVRVLLLKEIEANGFLFFGNYTSAKAKEIEATGKAAFVLHWKTLRRQIRVRGLVSKEDGAAADDYYQSRSLGSRLGAWASDQSAPLATRADLEKRLAQVKETHGDCPSRPAFWGGFRVIPLEIEFWADGPHRLHDRFLWKRNTAGAAWEITRLNP